MEKNDYPGPRAAGSGTLMEQAVRIHNPMGLHARPAAQLAAICKKAERAVWIEANAERVDAKSTLDILSLGLTAGTHMRIGVADPADAHIIDELLSSLTHVFRKIGDHD